MKPSNSKSIYAILCDNIEEIQSLEKTSFSKCDALVKLSNAALAIKINEIANAKAQIQLQEWNNTHTPIEIRDVEGKAFDNSKEK